MINNFDSVLQNRPSANHSIEQFLMTPEKVIAQAELVGPYLQDSTVFFLGDDDHVSPLLAVNFGIKPVVYEVDNRVIESLRRSYKLLGVTDFEVRVYDARNPISNTPDYDGFYLNPPYSSKSEGLGIKIWLARIMEACNLNSKGVLVMPWDGGNINQPWVDDVQHAVSIFLDQHSFSIEKIDHNVHTYEEVNDNELMSSNIYLQWHGSKPNTSLPVNNLYN